MLNVNTMVDRSRIYFSISAHHLFLKDMLSESVRLFRKKGFTADFDMSLDKKDFKYQQKLKTDAMDEFYMGFDDQSHDNPLKPDL